MPAIKTTTGTPRSPRRPPVAFHVAGEDLFLDGLFRRWQSTVSTGPDLDEATVQLIVDATSPEDLTDVPEESVLVFESHDVRKAGRASFRARGVLRAPGGDRPVEVMFEVPGGHNAYFAATFSVHKNVLGDTWNVLLPATGQGPADLDAERRMDPRMGMRLPDIARA